MHRIKILPAQIEFMVTGLNTILDEALQAGINLPHSCKDGDCHSCVGKIISGKVKQKLTLAHTEVCNNHNYLLCQSYAQSDLEILIKDFNNAPPIKTLVSKVITLEKSNNVAIVKLQLPFSQKFNYYAGQYIDILLEHQVRSYSIANFHHTNNQIELHVRYYQGGIFSKYVWEQLTLGTIIRFKGPLGSFKINHSSQSILLVCTGTGFAPIKSILEQMIAESELKTIHLYWGNYTVEDFYLLDQLKNYVDNLNLKIKLCIPDLQVTGFAQGLVTQLIKNDFHNLNEYQVYACGNINMIRDLYQISIKELGLPKENFFSDAFTPSSLTDV